MSRADGLLHLGVSYNRGTPKNYYQWMIWGYPKSSGNHHIVITTSRYDGNCFTHPWNAMDISTTNIHKPYLTSSSTNLAISWSHLFYSYCYHHMFFVLQGSMAKNSSALPPSFLLPGHFRTTISIEYIGEKIGWFICLTLSMAW